MAGIYIHIPFCKQACTYCNFYFSTSTQQVQPLMQAIEQELIARKTELGVGTIINTIYFGGGTPGFIPTHYIAAQLALIYKHYTVSPIAEITLELNPDDATAAKLNEYKHIGINRLSIGIQSIFDEDLLFMNRAHDAASALQVIDLARHSGFHSLTIDLIFGYPLLSHSKWEYTLEQIAKFGLPHISAYSLTVEPHTALAHQITKGIVPDINDEHAATQFMYIMQWAAANNYLQYEISNYAQPNKQAVHNTNYWFNVSYLGIGPSAHSYSGNTRRWNVSNNAQYIKAMQSGNTYWDTETLSPTNIANEYIMTRLRLHQGLDLSTLKNMVTPTHWQCITNAIKANHNYLIQEANTVRLNTQGKLLADNIIAQLFA
jgi:oxygen-independent coproporphyrinogen III oxidase